MHVNSIQARSKVHVYVTLFSNYTEMMHPYEEPTPLPPYCAFKFYFSKFAEVRDACALFLDAVEHFGAFEFDKPPFARRIASCPEDFERKVAPLSFLDPPSREFCKKRAARNELVESNAQVTSQRDRELLCLSRGKCSSRENFSFYFL